MIILMSWQYRLSWVSIRIHHHTGGIRHSWRAMYCKYGIVLGERVKKKLPHIPICSKFASWMIKHKISWLFSEKIYRKGHFHIDKANLCAIITIGSVNGLWRNHRIDLVIRCIRIRIAYDGGEYLCWCCCWIIHLFKPVH